MNEDDEIDICYDVNRVGERHAPLLMIMGLACPLTWWHPDFCGMLAENGFPLIRFDNRDCGNSTRISAGVRKNLSPLRAALFHKAPYTVDDMAEDAAGLIRKLEGVEQVHVMGISLGGMVAQALAINHPDLVLSMTCINSCPKMRVWPPSQGPSRAVRKRLRRDQPTTSRTEWLDYPMPLCGYLADIIRRKSKSTCAACSACNGPGKPRRQPEGGPAPDVRRACRRRPHPGPPGLGQAHGRDLRAGGPVRAARRGRATVAALKERAT